MILTADWHLTDRPEDEYRWRAFDALDAILATRPHAVYHLGDLTDRKDKHSAALVNRLLDRLLNTHDNMISLDIIMGNHDAPLRGEPFWNLINYSYHQGVQFHAVPAERGPLVLLPFSPNPTHDWEDIDLRRFKAAFIHQPVDGVKGENGFELTGCAPLPIWPRGLKVYAGDIHNPQKVGRVQYVGAPHHVKFGDTYPCRMLILNDDTFEIEEEIILSPPAKALVEITSVAQLQTYNFAPGDQVKVRFSLPAEDLKNFAADERKIAAWATARGIRVSSLETLVIEDLAEGKAALTESDDPEAVLRAFAAAEGLDTERLSVGLDLLKSALT